MGRTRFKLTALVLLGLLLFAHPVSAGCDAHQDCCGGDKCECLISPSRCHAAVGQPAPVQLETAVGLPAAPVVINALTKADLFAANAKLPGYLYAVSINNHPPTGPPPAN